ncbi:tetratricopeptide repeat protein [Alterisphingorhabdus coralli]|uniref:Tetratricopeptide repeat protein n=1 Tax=Alterisphingorhabdus coralli TaxID=3071408 RepID=A0AA97FAF8_9SPHN|nr:tetratricopeptide repeat protein [Parasphingorhabdus sp. SCSIO 66989]WOE75475.1 hypothetical protein RB602_01815 [Parasphingorhabdus sp. SCSIO 66989]
MNQTALSPTWQRVFAWLMPALLIAMLPACGIGPQSTMDDAQTAFAANDYRTARIHLLNLLDNSPNDDAANLLYARTMLALGDGLAAQAAIGKISDNGTDDATRSALLAHSDIMRGVPQKAIDRLEPIAPEARNGEMYRMLIWAHRENGTLDDNADLFAEALERHNDNADLHALVARDAITRGDDELARTAATNALARDDDNYEALLVQAELQILDEDLTGAKTRYANIAKRYPGHAVPLANIVGVEIDMGNYDAAEKLIAQTEAEHPGFPFLQYQKARLAFAREDYRGANDILQSMPDYVHDYPPGLVLSAEIAEALGNREIAIARLERLLAIVPDDETAREKLNGLTR